MPQKIAIVHFSAPPVVGGVESVLAQHARHMLNAGHQVTIVAGRGGADDGVRFAHVPLIDSRHPDVLAAKAQLDIGVVPDDFEQLIEVIERALTAALYGHDVVIAHNVCSLHKNLALTAALRRVCARSGAPRLIIWHHDLAWTTPRYRAELFDGWPWQLICEDWPEVGPTHVVVSELRRRELAGLLQIDPERIQVIPSGLDLNLFQKLDAQTADLVQQLQLYRAAPLFLLPVRITRRKNIELAVRTIAALRSHFPRAVLVVTGPPGPHNPSNQLYFNQLRTLRAKLELTFKPGTNGAAVHFLAEIVDEYLPDVLIGDLFRLADALLFPSREEGFGIPMLEAGLVGLPIFCADIPPLREIAGSRANYFLPDEKPAAVAQLITQELQNSDVYQLRQHVRQNYIWENIYVDRIAPLL